MTDNGTIVLIDGHAQVYRAYHGIPALTNARGEPINALYGLARFLIWLDTAYPHEFGAVVFDLGPPRKRLELLPEYKAQRPSMPEELRSQIPPAREWIEAAGWPLLEEEGREADDLIAAVVKARDRHPVYIVSHDKDIGQLIEDKVIQLVPDRPGGKSRVKEVSASVLREKMGIPPRAVPDYLAMVGDSSDNIPGLPGVGAKTAAALIDQFGDLSTMLARTGEIGRPALRERVETSRDLLLRNRQLTVLDASPPAGWRGLEGLRRRKPDWGRLRGMALRNDFKSLLPVIDKGETADRNPRLL